MAKISPAGKKALLWLFSQGGSTINAGRMSAALNSLSLCGVTLVKGEWGNYGPHGGRKLRWTLTDRGIAQAAAEVARREGER